MPDLTPSLAEIEARAAAATPGPWGKKDCRRALGDIAALLSEIRRLQAALAVAETEENQTRNELSRVVADAHSFVRDAHAKKYAAEAALERARDRWVHETDNFEKRVRELSEELYEARTGLIAEQAKIKRLRAEREWRPMETAPRDGTDILLCGTPSFSQDTMVVACWDADAPHPSHPWLTLDGEGYHKDAFTAWQPLPAPPAGKETGDG